MGFYGSNDPTNSVKALKKDRSNQHDRSSHEIASITITQPP